MSRPTPTKDSSIVVVGASVLGLSTALHLASRGYTSITLLDRHPNPHPFSYTTPSRTSGTKYAPLHYTSHYHALSLSALTAWAQWNESLWSSSSSSSSQADRLWINNGFYTLFAKNNNNTNHDNPPASAIPDTALQRITYLERRRGLKLALLASSDPDHVDSATSRMFCIDPFRVLTPQNGGGGGGGPSGAPAGAGGVLDTLGGTILVDPAWSFAVARVKRLLAADLIVFDENAGCVDQILFSSREGGPGKNTVTGVRTRDGKTHEADFVVWACDPSEARVVFTTKDNADDTREPPHAIPQPFINATSTTTETIFQVRISPDDDPDLWDRLSEDNFPSWTHALPPTASATAAAAIPSREQLIGFPRDEQGHIQIIHHQGGPPHAPSLPPPATTGDTPRSQPATATNQVSTFLSVYLPDLLPLPTTTITTRTTSFPDRAVVDRPPSTANLLLAHDPRSPHQTFMFLPVIGSAVVDVLEGGPHLVKGWRWPVAASFAKGARL